VISTGRTATTFTSAPTNSAEELELGAVIEALCGDLPGVVLAQTLLEPGEREARAAFVHAGFQWVGGLAYMRRAMPKRGEFGEFVDQAWPDGVVVRRTRPGDDALIMVAMERSYIETLDCPELCGLRDTADVLTSHRATGSFDPTLWWIVEIDGSAEGLMLFNPCPDQASVELVYLGLSPKARGRGLGARLLRMGLGHLAARREPTITCAVDERNEPALRLYRAHGFSEFAHRTALVRPVGARGVEKPSTSA
jgi:ribosomal protein S18 acetylase RimI-like enzyme